MRYFTTAFVVLLLSGCALTGGTPSQEFTAETVGTIETTSEVVNEYGMSTKELIMFAILAGWAIPSPLEFFSSIFKGITGVIGAIRKVV